MHSLQVVHGNLKAVGPVLSSLLAHLSVSDLLVPKANIYIRGFHVCIADFGISTIARQESWSAAGKESTPSLVSFTPGGSIRWMSPELLDPQRFNAQDPRPTKESDRFALGMVIYEVCNYEYPSFKVSHGATGALWTNTVRWLEY